MFIYTNREEIEIYPRTITILVLVLWMSCSQPNAWMVSPNEAEETRVWTDYSNISSKHYSNQCKVKKNKYIQLSEFHKLLSQKAVTDNAQKNYPASQVKMDQIRHIVIPNSINKCHTR